MQISEWLQRFIDFFALEWLVGDEIRLAIVSRIFVWLIVFVLFFESLTRLLPPERRVSKRAATIISIALATIGALYIDPATLLALGGLYGTTIAIALLIFPALLGIWACFTIKPKTKASLFFRAALAGLLFYLFLVFTASIPKQYEELATLISFGLFLFFLYTLFAWILGKEE